MTVQLNWETRELVGKGTGGLLSKRKQIYVLESEGLLSTSIVNLIDTRTEHAISSITPEELAMLDLPGCETSTVIIVEEDQLRQIRSELIALVEREARVQIIMIRLKDTVLNILEKRVVRIEEVVDFLNLL
ncbi:MAG: hypothetical protein ACK2UK_18950 [Candidatus Promineifilaceae bacterium]